MGLVALEWGLNPFARAALRDPVQRPYALLRIAIAFASTAVLVATRNFWLALLLHLTVEIAAAIWRPLGESEYSMRATFGVMITLWGYSYRCEPGGRAG